MEFAVQTQTFIDRDWFDYCEMCGAIEHDGPLDGRVLCQSCWHQVERTRAEKLGFFVSQATSDDEVGDMLDKHHRACQFLSLVWNDSLKRSAPIVQDGQLPSPWTAHAARYVPADEIDRLAVECAQDDDLMKLIYDSLHLLLSEHWTKSVTEVDPRYDTGQLWIRRAYWPAIPHDAMYLRILPIVWERWNRFLPVRIAPVD